MNPKEIDTSKKPIVKTDKSLDFFNDKPLFPEKIEKANEMLKRLECPSQKIPAASKIYKS